MYSVKSNSIPEGIGTLRSLSALTLRVETGHNVATNKMQSFGVRLRSECADGAYKELIRNFSISDPNRTVRIAQFLFGTQTETWARKAVKMTRSKLLGGLLGGLLAGP